MYYSQKEFPLSHNIFLKPLNDMWVNGWFDEFSNNHFLIVAIIEQKINYRTKEQVEIASTSLYNENDNDAINFLINLSCVLNKMIRLCGEKQIEQFVKNQLSAGKDQYDEDQFFQALHEIQVFNFFTNYGNPQVKYEIPIGGESGKRNPEFRICNEFTIPGPTPEKPLYNKQFYTFDIEVKSVEGRLDSSINDDKPFVVPTIAIDFNKRVQLKALCENRGFQLELPNITHVCDFLNDAADKFEYPKESNHYNILFLNWTHREIPKINFIEPLSILWNEDNGLLRFKEIGGKKWLTSDVYEKISAIFIYSFPRQVLTFQDLKWVYSTDSYAVIINPSLKKEQQEKLNLLLRGKNNDSKITNLIFSLYNKGGILTDQNLKSLREIQEYIESIPYK